MKGLVFISYRREKGYALAHLVNAELRARGLRTFLDVAESDPGQFWPQIQSAIRSCRALVVICTKDSFETKPGDDWVLREIDEATKHGRQIIPVFSQDFTPPSTLPASLAQAMANNGVSMDTQFHVAAFDHLSQLVGGRKRSEQRRRVAISWVLGLVVLVAALALGARNINRLNDEANRERDARQAATAQSEQLARNLAAMEKKTAEERQAVEEQQRRIDARSKQLEENLTTLDLKAEGEKLAEDNRVKTAQQDAQVRAGSCRDRCDWQAYQCHTSCPESNGNLDTDAGYKCDQGCMRTKNSCRANCD